MDPYHQCYTLTTHIWGYNEAAEYQTPLSDEANLACQIPYPPWSQWYYGDLTHVAKKLQ